jgi:hypothetical protein
VAIQGADVADLERLAAQFSQAAQRLEQVRSSIDAQLGLPLGWRGPDSERFTQLWRHEAAQRLRLASAQLNAGATDLLRNAREQEGASSVGGGAANAGITDDEIFSAIGIAGIIGGYTDTFKSTAIGDYFGKITSLLGLVDAGRSIDEGVRSGDGTGAALGGVDLASAGLGLAGRAFGPLSAALGVFTTFVESTIPVHPEDYDGMRAAGARSAFGKDPEDLTDSQIKSLDHRYDGPIGVAHMISDQMDSTADKVGQFFGKLLGG